MLALRQEMTDYTLMSEFKPSPTVYGIETEYSCMVTLPGNVVHEIVGSCHSKDVKLGLYSEPAQKGTSTIQDAAVNAALEKMGIVRVPGSGMMSNGSRFYFDPSGPEYASAETTSAEEAAHRTFDGDEIVLNMFNSLRKAGILEGFQFNRRVVDHNRSSRGIHLNTTTTLPADVELSKEDIERIATLNVVKGALFGSGGLLLNEKGQTQYHHSPRLSVTTDLSASYLSYRKRPLVRLPFKADGQLARIETVTSDALNFAWPIRASLVATNALITLLEMGYGNKLPVLRDPISAAGIVGRFGNTNQISVLNDDEYVGRRPADVLREICETALEVDEIEGQLDRESDQVLSEIIDIADKINTDHLSVVNQVESVARWVAMERKMQKDGLTLDSERICRFDYAWDWAGGGIAETLRRKNLAGWYGFKTNHSIRDMARRIVAPPADTRAKLRGNLIKSHKGANSSSWEEIDFGDGSEHLTYVHPLATELPTI